MDLQDSGSEVVSTSYGDVSIPAAESSAPQGGEASPAPATQPAEATPWWQQHASSELEFNAAGKPIKAPLSKVIQWAQQGYDYPQKVQSLNQQRAEFEAKQAELAKDSEWAEVVKFARENPEWAQYTRQQWEQKDQWRQQAATDPNLKPFLDEIQQLKSELATFKPVVQEFQSERTRLQQESEDKALEAQIGAVKERYAKVGMDLSQADPETGESYEYEILKYASEAGIKDFRAALEARYGDKLEALREEAFKKRFVDEQAKRAKEGFIGRSPTPQTSAPKVNPRKMSWGDAAEYAQKLIADGKY